MEQFTPQVYCQRAALELAALLGHQRRPRTRTRRDSVLLRRFVQEVLASAPEQARRPDGPWQAGQRPLKRPGRGGLAFIPLVQRGATTIMVSTPEEAEQLAAFLNLCGMYEFGG